jgi:hypothetical protein
MIRRSRHAFIRQAPLLRRVQLGAPPGQPGPGHLGFRLGWYDQIAPARCDQRLEAGGDAARVAGTGWRSISRTALSRAADVQPVAGSGARLRPVTVYAQKTRTVFQAGVRFAGAVTHRDCQP